MRVSRRTIAAFLVPLLVALNGACLCPHAAFASESSPAVPVDRGCGHEDETPSSGDHSPVCPHCGAEGSVFVPSELSASVPAPAALPTAIATASFLPAPEVGRSLRIAVCRRAFSPPSVLERTCVLLI